MNIKRETKAKNAARKRAQHDQNQRNYAEIESERQSQKRVGQFPRKTLPIVGGSNKR